MGGRSIPSVSETPFAEQREERRTREHLGRIRPFIAKAASALVVDGPRVLRETGFPVAVRPCHVDPYAPVETASELRDLVDTLRSASVVGWQRHRNPKMGSVSWRQVLHATPHHPGWDPDAPDSFYLKPGYELVNTHAWHRDHPDITHLKSGASRQVDGPSAHACVKYTSARWEVSLDEFRAIARAGPGPTETNSVTIPSNKLCQV